MGDWVLFVLAPACACVLPLAAVSIVEASSHCWDSTWLRVNQRGYRLVTTDTMWCERDRSLEGSRTGSLNTHKQKRNRTLLYGHKRDYVCVCVCVCVWLVEAVTPGPRQTDEALGLGKAAHLCIEPAINTGKTKPSTHTH